MTNQELIQKLRHTAALYNKCCNTSALSELLLKSADRLEEEMLAYELLEYEYKITAEELRELQSGFSWRVYGG